MAGVFEALEGTGSSTGQVFILGSLVVTGDAAATAHNILANEALFRLGFLVSIAGVAFHLAWSLLDRKSTRLNSSHSQISYAVFCLKKKNVSLSRRARSVTTSRDSDD